MKKIYSLALGLTMMANCATAQNMGIQTSSDATRQGSSELGAALAAPPVQLPEPNKNVGATLMDVLQKRASVREFSDQEISAETLSLLLWAACGINREDGRLTAPSAINAQDIRLYVLRKDGAYLYQPRENQLQQVTDQDLRPAIAGRQASVAKAPVTLLMVSDQTRFGNRRNGAQLMGSFDAAYVSENICLAATALGLATVPRMQMDKEALKAGLHLADTDLPLLNNPVGWPAK